MELSQSFMYVITRGLHYTDEFTAGGFGSIDDRSLSLPSHSFLDHYTWPDVSQYPWICKFACNTVIRAVLIRKPYELFPSIWIIAYVCWPAQRRNSVEISNTVFVVTRQVSNIKWSSTSLVQNFAPASAHITSIPSDISLIPWRDTFRYLEHSTICDALLLYNVPLNGDLGEAMLT